MLDDSGVIRRVDFADTLAGEGGEDWLGQEWSETVGAVGRDAIRLMILAAQESGASGAQRILQRFPSGREVPIEYNMVRIGGTAGMIAVGRNLQAVAEVQASLLADKHRQEQAAWKLRDVETLYRLLFDTNQEPVFVIRALDMRILQANPAGARLYGFNAGQDFLDHVAGRDHETLRAMLARVRQNGRAPGIMVRMGEERASWILRASLAGQGPEASFLLRLTRVVASRRDAVPNEAEGLAALIDRLPVSFLLLDEHGIIRRANAAFAALAEAEQVTVIGEPLGRWLQPIGDPAAALVAAILREGVVRAFRTTVIGARGRETQVEVAAVGEIDQHPGHAAALLWESDAPPGDPASMDALAAALAGMAQRIDRVKLPQLVRRVGETVERHHILGALNRANGNRSAAADLLGLSRQTLYLKLARYGLHGAGDGDTGPDDLDAVGPDIADAGGRD
jgi:transcriptional regulator PpsR